MPFVNELSPEDFTLNVLQSLYTPMGLFLAFAVELLFCIAVNTDIISSYCTMHVTAASVFYERLPLLT